ncbi:hypothetical protein DAPPUDRAFT_316743 [Daphnia pulex]|uniref:Uncharacterized protein n=1 Tax=Daphnia pulex TaxID=6669 RepID=E9GDV3_DAPPU|nr:hypothetical protein DAPPUDRAFT_316743 [Daphnia pulex]|eukprot:EFX82147.1 hypothetical protein DAPPUDRAFT_316743 [Daphnia pulex]
MSLSLPYFIFFVGFGILNCFSSKSDPLNGQHLRVIWPNWSGNRKGMIGSLNGGVFLDALSARWNLTEPRRPNLADPFGFI